MLSDEQSQKHITTGSGDLNNILGGGIHCKEVTEIGGVPGVGKTQLGYVVPTAECKCHRSPY